MPDFTEELLGGFEFLLRHGQFTEVDALLARLHVEAMQPAEILAVLTITSHGKAKLTERDGFLAKAEVALPEMLGPERAEKLIKRRR